MPTHPTSPATVVYCRCAYAQTVPRAVKDEVLRRLCDSGRHFEAVSDLCQMSAQNDPRLERIAACGGPLKIAACFPRAVKWLFHAAGSPLPDDGVEVLNMREHSADEIAAQLQEEPSRHA